MFEINIPTVKQQHRSIKEIETHLYNARMLHKRFPKTLTAMYVATEAVFDYIADKLSFKAAEAIIYEAGKDLGLSGICLGPIMVDLKEVKDVYDKNPRQSQINC